MEANVYCVYCDLMVLRAGKGEIVSETDQLLTGKGQTETEDINEWVLVKNMFDFENVAYSRDHKNLPGGRRLLTCAGCEKGIIGKATPIGSGPDMKMTSYLAPTRVKKH